MDSNGETVSPRLVVYLTAAVFCHAACTEAFPQRFRYVVAGQSNAQGNSTLPTPTVSWYGRSFGHDNVWRTANDPSIHFPGGTRTSPWPQLIVERFASEGLQVRLVATARGGSCLVYGSAEWDPDTGSFYADMLAYVALSGWNQVDAVLWHQGECDAQESMDQGVSDPVRYAVYKAALKNLADAIEQDLSAPIVVAPISLRWCKHTNPTGGDITCDPATYASSDPKRLPIHDATIDAASEHPNIVLGPLSDDLSHEDGPHIRAVNELGTRWAEVLEAL